MSEVGIDEGTNEAGGSTGAEETDSLMAAMLAEQKEFQMIMLKYNMDSNIAHATHTNKKSMCDKIGQS